MLNINLNLKARLLSKTFWISLISLVVLLAQQIGFDITTIIPKNYAEIVNTIFAIFALLGIVVDTSTPGISDKVIQDTTIQTINDTNTKEEVKVEGATTAINSTITENSQSASEDTINSVAVQAENEKLKAQLQAVKATFADNITNPSDKEIVSA